MLKFNEWLAEKGIKNDAFANFEAEKQAELYNEYNEQFRTKLNDLEANGATKSEIETLKSDLAKVKDEQFNQLKSILKEQGVELKKLKDGQRATVVSNSISKSLNENKATLEKMANGSQGGSFSFKAVGNMSLSGNVTGQVPQAERIEGLNTIASRKVRLLDIVSKGVIGSNLVEWVYQSNKEGSAGATAEGTLKNQIDFDLLVGSAKVEKVTAFIKATTEMLSDISWIEQEIKNELTRELMKKIESGIYSANGITPNLNGYRTQATSFSAGSFANAIDNANQVDVLVVAANQIAIADQEAPNYILMHPTDVTKLKVEKMSSTDKRYVERLQMIGGSLMMDGIPIMETTLVSVGEYLIGNFGLAKLLTKDGGLKITVGLDSDDFTKNFRTILAEWRGVSFIKHNDRTAFVKGVFTTDMASLETA